VVNDFQNNHGTSIISPFQEDMLADNNILAKISTDCCKDSCCQHIKRIYFGPVNLTKLEIKLMDEYGRILDMNNMDYSLSFELEILYGIHVAIPAPPGGSSSLGRAFGGPALSQAQEILADIPAHYPAPTLV
jgi:hypothetical protein